MNNNEKYQNEVPLFSMRVCLYWCFPVPAILPFQQISDLPHTLVNIAVEKSYYLSHNGLFISLTKRCGSFYHNLCTTISDIRCKQTLGLICIPY